MLGDKLRFRFAKAGALRLLSHHDLMRCFERMLRRAGLPFKSTNGFHPSPRVVFALSLPLGVVGRQEVVEIEFTQQCDSDAVLEKLNAQAPEGLVFSSATVVPMKATALPRRVVYTLSLGGTGIPACASAGAQARMPVPPENQLGNIADACRALMAEERVWVDRLKPSPKQLNIRPYFRSLSVIDTALSLDLWVTQTGTARADELLRLLDLDDLLEAGYVLSRDVLELRDEAAAADPTDQPPDGPAETLPLNHAFREETPLPAASHFAPMVE
ncbi:MAG TPA: TIGR03936 family radical SAM-associated protein [Urbifossiella sp.]|jgi:radical SAM-linked protein|nr:TIGR03936 family radical SAM-associated protein [Urbifossiella sp.]